jgi:hypothetical protein
MIRSIEQSPISTRDVLIGAARLSGTLRAQSQQMPSVFVRGSGSSRLSPRNIEVA